MATVTVLTNDDGSIKIHPVHKQPWLHYDLEDGESVFETSRLVDATITTSDGTPYDLSPPIVVTRNAAHIAEIAVQHDALHHAAHAKRVEQEAQASLAG